jgi:hypothetical protein
MKLGPSGVIASEGGAPPVAVDAKYAFMALGSAASAAGKTAGAADAAWDD